MMWIASASSRWRWVSGFKAKSELASATAYASFAAAATKTNLRRGKERVAGVLAGETQGSPAVGRCRASHGAAGASRWGIVDQAPAPVASSAVTGIVAMTKAKLNAVASVAAKAALRRLLVMVGTPSGLCEAAVVPPLRWSGDSRAWGASVNTVIAVRLCSDA